MVLFTTTYTNHEHPYRAVLRKSDIDTAGAPAYSAARQFIANTRRTHSSTNVSNHIHLLRFVQSPAKDARLPFEQGALTQKSPRESFGVKIFVVLAVKYQAVDHDDEEGDVQEALNVRVSASGTLSNICGPYARLLYDVLARVVRAQKEKGLNEVRQMICSADVLTLNFRDVLCVMCFLTLRHLCSTKKTKINRLYRFLT